MFRLYLNILALSVSVSTFAVLAVSVLLGHAVTRHDLIFPTAMQVLLISLVFIVRELVRRYDARVAARVLVQRTGAQLAEFKATLLPHRPQFSKGFRTWNS